MKQQVLGQDGYRRRAVSYQVMEVESPQAAADGAGAASRELVADNGVP